MAWESQEYKNKNRILISSQTIANNPHTNYNHTPYCNSNNTRQPHLSQRRQIRMKERIANPFRQCRPRPSHIFQSPMKHLQVLLLHANPLLEFAVQLILLVQKRETRLQTLQLRRVSMMLVLNQRAVMVLEPSPLLQVLGIFDVLPV